MDMPAVPGVRQIETPTAEEMHAEVMKRSARDRHPHHGGGGGRLPGRRRPAGGKIGKSRDEWAIDLEATPDILCDVAAAQRRPVPGGFRGRVRARRP